MFHKFNLIILTPVLLVMMATASFAREYIIYSIGQNLPMGDKEEKIKKNYYINMGTNQGIRKGTTLDVYRSLSRVDPYENNKRYNYKIKIGEIEVIHAESQSGIGKLSKMEAEENTPITDIEALMVGDQVSAHVK